MLYGTNVETLQQFSPVYREEYIIPISRNSFYKYIQKQFFSLYPGTVFINLSRSWYMSPITLHQLFPPANLWMDLLSPEQGEIENLNSPNWEIENSNSQNPSFLPHPAAEKVFPKTTDLCAGKWNFLVLVTKINMGVCTLIYAEIIFIVFVIFLHCQD